MESGEKGGEPLEQDYIIVLSDPSPNCITANFYYTGNSIFVIDEKSTIWPGCPSR